jgi:hypothetical protein
MNYRNFEAVVEKAKLACFNSGMEDHSVDVTEMIEIGKVGQRAEKGKRLTLSDEVRRYKMVT